jgi:hypothetical protein
VGHANVVLASLANYYRRFVQGYAKLAAPSSALSTRVGGPC